MTRQTAIVIPYYVAVIAIGTALVLRYLLIDQTNEDSTFLAGVAVTAMIGGLWPGIAAMAMSVAAMAADYPILYHDADHPLATVLFFLMVSVLISAFCGLLKASQRKARLHAHEAAVLRDRIISISEAEQRRIGQDLHDNLGQQLTGIAFLSQSLASRLTKRRAAEAEEAKRIVNMVSQTIGWTRDLARGLTPVAVETDDLASALRHLADTTASMFKIRCEFIADEEPIAPALDLAIHLFRITQEAINNAIKHAQATEIRVELRGGPHPELSVHDNGKGIGSAATQMTDGLGLQIMRHRASLIHAELMIGDAEDGGTMVRCRVNGEAS